MAAAHWEQQRRRVGSEALALQLLSPALNAPLGLVILVVIVQRKAAEFAVTENGLRNTPQHIAVEEIRPSSHGDQHTDWQV